MLADCPQARCCFSSCLPKLACSAPWPSTSASTPHPDALSPAFQFLTLKWSMHTSGSGRRLGPAPQTVVTAHPTDLPVRREFKASAVSQPLLGAGPTAPASFWPFLEANLTLEVLSSAASSEHMYSNARRGHKAGMWMQQEECGGLAWKELLMGCPLTGNMKVLASLLPYLEFVFFPSGC